MWPANWIVSCLHDQLASHKTELSLRFHVTELLGAERDFMLGFHNLVIPRLLGPYASMRESRDLQYCTITFASSLKFKSQLRQECCPLPFCPSVFVCLRVCAGAGVCMRVCMRRSFFVVAHSMTLLLGESLS